MQQFKVTYYLTNGDCHTKETEAHNIQVLSQEIADVDYHVITKENGRVLINRDHVTEIYITDITEVNKHDE